MKFFKLLAAISMIAAAGCSDDSKNNIQNDNECPEECPDLCNDDGSCKAQCPEECPDLCNDDGSCKTQCPEECPDLCNDDGSCKTQCPEECSSGCDDSGNCACPDSCTTECNDDGTCLCPSTCKTACDENGICQCPNSCINGCDDYGSCTCAETCKTACDENGKCQCSSACSTDCNDDGTCVCPSTCKTSCDENGKCLCPDTCNNGCNDDGTCACLETCETSCNETGKCQCPSECPTSCDENGKCEVLECTGCGTLLKEGRTSIKYSECGAKADGKTNDIQALIDTHNCANKFKLKVFADSGKTYYVDKMDKGATIQTDTDWTGAKFTIDDSKVGTDKRGINLFNVTATEGSKCLVGTKEGCPNQLKTLKNHQANLGITLPKKSIVKVVNDKVKLYIREGANQNNGSSQSDILLVDPDGKIDSNSPIMWDYNYISSATYTPIDETVLTLKGGEFTTIANQAPSEYTYYARGISVQRANVVVDGLKHYVKGELDHGAPYNGILSISNAANVTVKNCTFTAHKTYDTTGSANTRVSMGTYDIAPSNTINLTFDNCTQTTDILDTAYWGIMGSNFCKNIVVKDCTFSRFDAHQGVVNVTITGSTLGHQCLNIIGEGTLKVINSTLYGNNFINLRSDYGSTWNGNVEITNCTWIPGKGKAFSSGSLIYGSFSGKHDFGYPCYMPKTITINGLTVDDSKANSSYNGIYLFSDITKDNTSSNFKYTYPYTVTKTVNISNFKSKKGKKWQLSPNKYMFNKVTINEK